MKQSFHKPYDVAFLVVLYDCTIEQSETLRCLYERSFIHSTALIIWNNGPETLTETKNSLNNTSEQLEIALLQTPNNASLSKIYNHFINNVDAKRYVIFDHDTTISDHYFKTIMTVEHGQLGLPLVYTSQNNNLIYPIVNHKKVQNGKRITAEKQDYLMSCTSGIIVGAELANELKQSFSKVFDEHFVLYGVDTSFFLRIRRLGLFNNIVLVGNIQHSLSQFVTNEKNATFRTFEREYDLGLTLRYYPNKYHFKILYHIFKLRLTKRTQFRLTNIFKAYIRGKHYRDTTSELLFIDKEHKDCEQHFGA